MKGYFFQPSESWHSWQKGELSETKVTMLNLFQGQDKVRCWLNFREDFIIKKFTHVLRPILRFLAWITQIFQLDFSGKLG